MQQEDFKTWEEFENQIEQLQAVQQKSIGRGGYVSDLLYRGQESHAWLLKTTLDRLPKQPWSLNEYDGLLSNIRPQVETFTGQRWKEEDFSMMLADPPGNPQDPIGNPLSPYDYLVFLRHHGFPSPLLDWTRSPYVAAFFAFRELQSERVAIYVYQEITGQGKEHTVGDPKIVSYGPRVRSHSRHFLQQSQYTMAMNYQEKKWWYVSHEDVFSTGKTTQDRLWKFTLPVSERIKVLRVLDAHNLNAFSLFQTEEALLETMAVREIEFPH